MIEDLGNGRCFGKAELEGSEVSVKGPRSVVAKTLTDFERRVRESIPLAPIPGQLDLVEELTKIS